MTASAPKARAGRLGRADVVGLLSPAVGHERAVASVTAVATRLGIDLDSMTPAQARALLDDLGADAGVLGSAARLAASRVRVDAVGFRGDPLADTVTAERPTTRIDTPSLAMSSIPVSGTRAISGREVVIDLLAQPLGRERATDVVDETARGLGLPLRFDRAAALRVLDAIAERDGILGVAARFASARLAMKG
jgi:hypothetical protein